MSDLSSERKMIQTEESRFRFALSESMIQKIGRAINFINNYQHSEKQFFLNGFYAIVPAPQLGVDGLVVFQYNVEIIDVIMFNLVAGSGGTTELDLKKQTASGGAFASIFSTTPKITAGAGNNARIGIGETVSGCTAPVLVTANLSAGEALRLDKIQVQSGDPENCGLIVHYRPR